MNRPDFLSQLPSLDELLEHPRVAAAIDRVNRSSAATQVRSAISSLGAEIARRTEGLHSLGAGELLDRLVRQLESPRTAPPAGCVNATGRWFDPAVGRPPLPQAAADAALLAACSARPKARHEAAYAAAKLLGAGAGYLASSPARALVTALETLASGGVCVVARGDMTELVPGVRLDEVCRRSGVGLREVGAADSATIEDYRGALASLASEGVERRVVLLRGCCDAADGEWLKSVVDTAGQGGAVLIVDRGRARPRRDTPAYSDTSPSLEETVAAGADVVVFDAAGLIGGPAGGGVVGKPHAVDAIAGSTAAKLDPIDPMIDAALAATLALFERPNDLRFNHPLHRLLDAPSENLRHRAERLATRIAALGGVGSANAVETTNTLRAGAWAVRVEPAEGEGAAALGERLKGAEPSVLANEDGPAVVLDLSTVPPSQDGAVVGAFGPESAESAENAG